MRTSQLLSTPKEKRLKCKPEVPFITQKAYFDLVKFLTYPQILLFLYHK